ncbi:hypothetical protein [Dinghuibacter silviterrae]|uniref:hypothetical protein n=1 Tax=Dinghuibacter silviterrae TaxID=1539049 RepID=UPI0010631264|nr:hypothetical protein [Dinghuibacter silviterrae]
MEEPIIEIYGNLNIIDESPGNERLACFGEPHQDGFYFLSNQRIDKDNSGRASDVRAMTI